MNPVLKVPIGGPSTLHILCVLRHTKHSKCIFKPVNLELRSKTLACELNPFSHEFLKNCRATINEQSIKRACTIKVTDMEYSSQIWNIFPFPYFFQIKPKLIQTIILLLSLMALCQVFVCAI